VNLANKVSSLFKVTVTDLNTVISVSTPDGIEITWEVGLKSDIGSGDLVVYVDKGGCQSFESVVGAISSSTGLSGDWFNQLAQNIYIGNMRFAVKGDLSVEIEIDQQIPDEIQSLMANEGMSSPYLYTIININLNQFISGLGADVLKAFQNTASNIFELVTLVIVVCVLWEVDLAAIIGTGIATIGAALIQLLTQLSNLGVQYSYN
jgi:hypothetical protein